MLRSISNDLPLLLFLRWSLLNLAVFIRIIAEEAGVA